MTDNAERTPTEQVLERIREWAESDPSSDDTGNAELRANWHGYNTAQEEVLDILKDAP